MQIKIQNIAFNEIFLIILNKRRSIEKSICRVKQNKCVISANIKKKIVTTTESRYIDIVINDLINSLTLKNLADYINEKFKINSILHDDLDLYSFLLNDDDCMKRSILKYAMFINNMQLILFILDNVSIKKFDGTFIQRVLSLLNNVSKNKESELLESLLHHPKINTIQVLNGACWNCDIEVARTLIEKNPNLINTRDDDGCAPIHVVCQNGYLEIVQMLIEKNPNLVNEKTDGDGWTTLHLACMNGHIEIASMLIEKNPNLVNEKTSNVSTQPYMIHLYSWTTLHLACRYGHIKTVSMLIEKNPNLVNEKTSDGWTALHLACKYDHIEIAKILISHSANINVRTVDNEVFLDVINNNDNIKAIINFILVENNIIIDSENYLFLSPEVFNKYSQDIPEKVRIAFQILINKIQAKSLVINKLSYVCFNNFIDNNIEKTIISYINGFIKSNHKTALRNDFIFFISTNEEKKHRICKHITAINDVIRYHSFTISYLQSQKTYGLLLKIDNINYSLLNNEMMQTNNPLNIRSNYKKPFIDINVITYT